MPTRFKTGMCVSWEVDEGTTLYGVVTDAGRSGVRVAEVLPLMPGVHCYDEGMDYRRDHDNVRLDSRPDAFAMMRVRHGVQDCYAYAPPIEAQELFEPGELDGLNILMDGELLDKADLDQIFCHPWPEQPELEKTREPADAAGAPLPEESQEALPYHASVALAALIAGEDVGPDPPEGPWTGYPL